MGFELGPPIPQSEPLTHVNIRKYYWNGWKRRAKEVKERGIVESNKIMDALNKLRSHLIFKDRRPSAIIPVCRVSMSAIVEFLLFLSNRQYLIASIFSFSIYFYRLFSFFFFFLIYCLHSILSFLFFYIYLLSFFFFFFSTYFFFFLFQFLLRFFFFFFFFPASIFIFIVCFLLFFFFW